MSPSDAGTFIGAAVAWFGSSGDLADLRAELDAA